ncbi:hypothetical protein BVG19_g2692 [[Candida] boidinii]|nr:hypothetical protein BVG19_g2692 [[Candida] boidinii]OWB51853.1 hypothetical protein B5S27_g3423 [[Candida] boidinii]
MQYLDQSNDTYFPTFANQIDLGVEISEERAPLSTNSDHAEFLISQSKRMEEVLKRMEESTNKVEETQKEMTVLYQKFVEGVRYGNELNKIQAEIIGFNKYESKKSVCNISMDQKNENIINDKIINEKSHPVEGTQLRNNERSKIGNNTEVKASQNLHVSKETKNRIAQYEQRILKDKYRLKKDSKRNSLTERQMVKRKVPEVEVPPTTDTDSDVKISRLIKKFDNVQISTKTTLTDYEHKDSSKKKSTQLSESSITDSSPSTYPATDNYIEKKIIKTLDELALCVSDLILNPTTPTLKMCTRGLKEYADEFVLLEEISIESSFSTIVECVLDIQRQLVNANIHFEDWGKIAKLMSRKFPKFSIDKNFSSRHPELYINSWIEDILNIFMSKQIKQETFAILDQYLFGYPDSDESLKSWCINYSIVGIRYGNLVNFHSSLYRLGKILHKRANFVGLTEKLETCKSFNELYLFLSHTSDKNFISNNPDSLTRMSINKFLDNSSGIKNPKFDRFSDQATFESHLHNANFWHPGCSCSSCAIHHVNYFELHSKGEDGLYRVCSSPFEATVYNYMGDNMSFYKNLAVL